MNQEAKWLLDEKYGGAECEAFRADLASLESGTPLAYIIGWVTFAGTKIYLDSHPLIPRPETEFWVMRAIEDLRATGKENLNILDLCAGSGCIGIAVLKAFPHATCDFVEIDGTHHETIRKNLQDNGITENHVKILGGNLFENVTGTYDAILTNPPYIDPHLSDRIQDSVINHEPGLALFGGTNGMELITEILTKAPGYLNENGVLYIEHEPEQKESIKNLLPEITCHKDQYKIIRYSIYKK